MKSLNLIFIVVLIAIGLLGCKPANHTTDLSASTQQNSRLASAIVPEDFDWSKVTYFKTYTIDPNTKEKREVFRVDLKSKTALPNGIEQLPVKTCEIFTDAEKLLAFGYQNTVTQAVDFSSIFLVKAYHNYYLEHGKEPTSPEQLPEYAFIKDAKKYQQVIANLSLYPEQVCVFSSITKTPFTFTNKEFSKGQFYITRITDKEYLRKFYNESTDLSKAHLYYYRIYGEDMTIAENVVDLSYIEK